MDRAGRSPRRPPPPPAPASPGRRFVAPGPAGAFGSDDDGPRSCGSLDVGQELLLDLLGAELAQQITVTCLAGEPVDRLRRVRLVAADRSGEVLGRRLQLVVGRSADDNFSIVSARRLVPDRPRL